MKRTLGDIMALIPLILLPVLAFLAMSLGVICLINFTENPGFNAGVAGMCGAVSAMLIKTFIEVFLQ